MKIHKITMSVKRVQYQNVEFSVSNGCTMPTDANDLVNMCESIKQDPLSNCDPDKWYDEDLQPEITSFDIEQQNEPSVQYNP